MCSRDGGLGEEVMKILINGAWCCTLLLMCSGLLSPIVMAQDMPKIVRLEGNPIIRPEMLPAKDGENINGPSLIRVPEWIEEPLGKYYLYFAHHVGQYIRLAYADSLVGPWEIYEPGTLRLEDTVCDDIQETSWAEYRHVASPDVHIDNEAKKIVMYFHGPMYLSGPRDEYASYAQRSLVATSADGIDFEAKSELLGTSYFRVFQWQSRYYALGMPGNFYRSEDGLDGFKKGPTLFTSDMRHCALTIRDDTLYVFYTIVGENPERILLSTIRLTEDWMTWKESPPVVLLKPEMEWEGALLPAEPSARGFAPGPVRQLRDPALYEEDGKTYLLYAVSGESGIAVARVVWP